VLYEGNADELQKSIADAMRELLETFRLPGEAQPISRITETFAEHFFSFRPREHIRFGLRHLLNLRSRDRESGRGLCARLFGDHAQYRPA
jgi:hypothetical protein